MIINRSLPPGTIIPVLLYREVRPAAAWLCQTFGFRERLRIGDHRIQLVWDEASSVVVAEASHADVNAAQSQRDGVTHSLMVRVADVDRHYAHVQACGARIILPPETYPFGERQYTVADLGGHRWTFTQTVADVAPEAWGGQLMQSAVTT